MRARVTCIALAALALSACQRTRDGVAVRGAGFEDGGMRVEVAVSAGELREGENELRVRVRDAEGEPVADARVSVQYAMSMAGGPPMGGRVTAEPLGGGEYRAHAMIDMAGTWQLAIEAERASGAVARGSGSMRTGASEIRFESRAAPAAASPVEPASGTVRVDPARLQKIGVRFATVEPAPLVRSVRALGRVTWDETRLVDVVPKVGGFVRGLRADALGVRVEKGESLFSVYSPDLYAAQAEYLQALQGGNAPLQRAARARLRLWDIADADVAALEKRGAALETLPLRSPASGVIVEKNVVEGAAFEAGARLFRIAPLERLWVEAEVYASDLGLVAVGQRAEIRAPYLPGRSLEARVSALLPSLASDSRTARIRLALENADLALRPEMFVDVELHADLGERLVVPRDAVIVSAARRIVFVDHGGGELEPRVIETGAVGQDQIEVLRGLEPGERVVASGNFLIAAESRLQSALEQW